METAATPHRGRPATAPFIAAVTAASSAAVRQDTDTRDHREGFIWIRDSMPAVKISRPSMTTVSSRIRQTSAIAVGLVLRIPATGRPKENQTRMMERKMDIRMRRRRDFAFPA